VTELLIHFPGLKYNYYPDFRDAIAKSWPESLDDTLAKKDWGWNPKCKDVKSLVEEVLRYIKTNYKGY
jgi:threonine 3-dehydrogenase